MKDTFFQNTELISIIEGVIVIFWENKDSVNYFITSIIINLNEDRSSDYFICYNNKQCHTIWHMLDRTIQP